MYFIFLHNKKSGGKLHVQIYNIFHREHDTKKFKTSIQKKEKKKLDFSNQKNERI